MSAQNVQYRPASTGQEIGVLFGFAAAMALIMCGYLVIWKSKEFPSSSTNNHGCIYTDRVTFPFQLATSAPLASRMSAAKYSLKKESTPTVRMRGMGTMRRLARMPLPSIPVRNEKDRCAFDK